VFVLDPSLCNENSPAREIKSVFPMTKLKNYSCYKFMVGHAVAQWLRHSATNQKVAGSIPDGVNGIFH
jgi:hypothetical protein